MIECVLQPAMTAGISALGETRTIEITLPNCCGVRWQVQHGVPSGTTQAQPMVAWNGMSRVAYTSVSPDQRKRAVAHRQCNSSGAGQLSSSIRHRLASRIDTVPSVLPDVHWVRSCSHHEEGVAIDPDPFILEHHRSATVSLRNIRCQRAKPATVFLPTPTNGETDRSCNACDSRLRLRSLPGCIPQSQIFQDISWFCGFPLRLAENRNWCRCDFPPSPIPLSDSSLDHLPACQHV